MGSAAQTKMDEVAHRYDAYEDILDRGLVPRGDDNFRHECDIIERAVAGKRSALCRRRPRLLAETQTPEPVRSLRLAGRGHRHTE
jgi:hypothetical protein